MKNILTSLSNIYLKSRSGFLLFFLVFSLFQVQNGLAQNTEISNSNFKTEDKLFLLSSFWKDAHTHFHSPERLKAIQFDSIYKKATTEAINSKSDSDFIRIFRNFVSVLDDGHTDLNVDGWIHRQGDTDFTSTTMDFIQNKYYIFASELDKQDQTPIGAEVTQINHIPISEYLEKEIFPFCSGSTLQQKRRNALHYLGRGKKGSVLTLTIRTDQKEYDIPLEYNWSAKKIDWKKDIKMIPILGKEAYHQQSAYLTEENYLYLNQLSFNNNRFGLEQLIERHSEFQKAKGIILDLRFNGGGSETIADFYYSAFLIRIN